MKTRFKSNHLSVQDHYNDNVARAMLVIENIKRITSKLDPEALDPAYLRSISGDLAELISIESVLETIRFSERRMSPKEKVSESLERKLAAHYVNQNY